MYKEYYLHNDLAHIAIFTLLVFFGIFLAVLVSTAFAVKQKKRFESMSRLPLCSDDVSDE